MELKADPLSRNLKHSVTTRKITYSQLIGCYIIISPGALHLILSRAILIQPRRRPLALLVTFSPVTCICIKLVAFIKIIPTLYNISKTKNTTGVLGVELRNKLNVELAQNIRNTSVKQCGLLSVSITYLLPAVQEFLLPMQNKIDTH